MTPRAALVAKFQDMKRRGVPIVGGGAGTGLSAKCEEAGGIDLIVIYNSGRFRMAGRGSLAGLLAYGDANAIVMDMAREVIPVVKNTPVLAGVNGTDPFRVMDRFLDEVKAAGFSGVQNFPTVGLIDGVFRANLEETGMSFSLEVDMIRLAREKELLTTPYVFCEDDAEAMAEAGADIIVVHLGLTTGGAIGAETALHLEDCPGMVDAWSAAALAVNPDVLILVHGGPVAMPEHAAYVLQRTRHCHGFYGASSMERLPTEQALTDQVKAFKRIVIRPAPERRVEEREEAVDAIVALPDDTSVEPSFVVPPVADAEAGRIVNTPLPVRGPYTPPIKEDRMDDESRLLYEEHGDIRAVFRILHTRGYPINDIAWKTGRSYQEVYRTIKEEERRQRN